MNGGDVAGDAKWLAMRKRSSAAAKIFDVLLRYEVNVKTVRLKKLQNRAVLSEAEVRDVMKELEPALGKVVRASANAPARFEFSTSFLDKIPGPLAGESSTSSHLAVAAKGSRLFSEFVCKLAGGREARLQLPEHASADDFRKLQRFISKQVGDEA
ncbi:hypothetical protein HHL11_19430 [Ramlibacter sp. G-1-2-2]|uniref:Uncharacterized protein n=1 Tax=Ramlibacter agri TaxID=2728837 RepID=A0A848H939_9BURK|nr:hypothetical protein [Ramlibacter agri]NML45930.1 hypothetical protein [Ramlibacter agri]